MMATSVLSLLLCHAIDEYKQTLFETTPVMSAYLLAFSIGDFDVLSAPTDQGTRVDVFFPPCLALPLP